MLEIVEHALAIIDLESDTVISDLIGTARAVCPGAISFEDVAAQCPPWKEKPPEHPAKSGFVINTNGKVKTRC